MQTGSGVDPQGDTVGYQWTLAAVPGRSTLTDADLAGAATATVSFVPDTAGRYLLRLVTDDGVGFSPPDTAEVLVVGEILVPEDYPTVGAALDAAGTGSTIDIGAGTFDARLDLEGKDLVIRGAGAGLTLLDGAGLAPVLRANHGETVTLEGLTLTHGLGGRGGGLWVDGGTVTATDLTLAENVACEGGGLYLDTADLVGDGVQLVANRGGNWGGGATLAGGSSLDLVRSTMLGNRVGAGPGGGARVDGSNLILTNVIVADNFAETGAGLYLNAAGTSGTLDHVTMVHNDTPIAGAAVYVSSSADFTLHDSIVAYNHGPSTLYESSAAFGFLQTWSLVSGNDDPAYDLAGTEPVDGVDGNDLDGDPAFTAVSDDGDWTNDDWTLDPASDAVDAGDPLGTLDPDGSAPDLGAFGGDLGDWTP
ncbi:MAG: hypothetical protein R3F59_29025 [Myxococcota bacterium]